MKKLYFLVPVILVLTLCGCDEKSVKPPDIPDTTTTSPSPLKIIGTIPGTDEKINKTAELLISFNKAIDKAYLNKDSFFIRAQWIIDGSTILINNNKTIKFIPNEPYLAGALCRAVISNIIAEDGSVIDTILSFRVKQDLVALESWPADNETGVSSTTLTAKTRFNFEIQDPGHIQVFVNSQELDSKYAQHNVAGDTIITTISADCPYLFAKEFISETNIKIKYNNPKPVNDMVLDHSYTLNFQIEQYDQFKLPDLSIHSLQDVTTTTKGDNIIIGRANYDQGLILSYDKNGRLKKSVVTTSSSPNPYFEIDISDDDNDIYLVSNKWRDNGFPGNNFIDHYDADYNLVESINLGTGTFQGQIVFESDLFYAKDGILNNYHSGRSVNVGSNINSLTVDDNGNIILVRNRDELLVIAKYSNNLETVWIDTVQFPYSNGYTTNPLVTYPSGEVHLENG